MLLSTGVYGWDLWSAHRLVPGLRRRIVHLHEIIILAQILSLVIDVGGTPASLDSSSHEFGIDSSKVLVGNLGSEVVTWATLYSELMLDDVLCLTQVFYTGFSFDSTRLRWNKLLIGVLRVLVMHQLDTIIAL